VHVIAGASPDNTPAGYYWTFLFPMLLFIVIALILWALFGRPHQRVPARRAALGLSSPAPGIATAAVVSTVAVASAADSAGPADAASAQPTATAEPEAEAAADESGDAQAPADGAGAGE
jgi:predicted kinase